MVFFVKLIPPVKVSHLKHGVEILRIQKNILSISLEFFV
jgi:hypothetical protein